MADQWEINVVPCGVDDYVGHSVEKVLSEGWEPFAVVNAESGMKLFLRRLKQEAE